MRDYLARNRFFDHRKVGFVDIGWNGTIQYFIGRAFAHEPDCPQVHGLYFGYCMGIPYQFAEQDRIEGLFYDEGKGFATERVVMSFEEVFEQSARASHGTTVGYRRDGDGRVEPIYKSDERPDRRAELACDPIIAALQAGILDFAGEYLRAIRLTGYRSGEVQPFLLSLAERALAYPNATEVARLTRLVHTEDWGHENVMDLEEVKSAGFWRDLRGTIRMSNWRNGTVAEHAGSLATWLFRYLDVIRRF
jgi:hypothetical protein